MNNRSGFTLVEIIVVIVIIALLSTIGFTSYTNIQKDSRAARIAADFQQMKLAMKVWRTSGSITQYPRETFFFPAVNFCSYNFYPISLTGAQIYLENTMKDPWDQEYFYDNDSDTYISGDPARTNAGVNILIWGCNDDSQRYRELAPLIDKTIDGSDGAGRGQVRWADSGSSVYILFLVADNEQQ
ncbi:hypothetical protein COY16_05200 [Candidatus Roizmanbacteria bacterium CG_4_10_14_0_2_um_filter_39_13]|uniref:Type II secretion system protein GspG C-terminal domain-containing protein n=1 Tax=Candidatus Roizmanbacteria bacterium CG_4_10_14_0_2_um_filter_39_13 TaxID=1974825 RepID=A0A2M7TWC2_9BACT|nr:MAG: hypothetical protein COY16_05200 [Candidatus Roizmanbacteria bacterium CG_4_10_14_0_2_um_filter_39_13]